MAKKRICSDETKKKISDSLRGRHVSPNTEFKSSWMKGRNINDRWGKEKADNIRNKKSETMKELHRSGVMRKGYKKIGIANTGRIPTMETRKKMSDWQKGRTLPKKTKTKMANTRKEIIKKRGYVNSMEARKKISDALMGHNVLKKTKNKIKKARAKQITPIKDTTIEIKIQNFLKQLGIEFTTHQYIKDIKYGYQCDVFIPVQEGIPQKTVIECDGDYWHGNLGIIPIEKLNKRILIKRCLDFERNAQLEEAGFRIIRLWENKINKMDCNELNLIIKK